MAVAILLCAGSMAWASDPPTISADKLLLLPDTADQVVHLNVSGGDTIWGEDLNFQINDGISGPTITNLDIITNTIFSVSNTGQGHPDLPDIGVLGIFTTGPYADRVAMVYTTTEAPATTVDNGLLVTLTISTEGFTGSTFTLNMVNTLNGPSDVITSDFTTINMTFPSNTFTVAVPEPAAGALLLVGAALLVRRRR
jgi:hypothetical protein